MELLSMVNLDGTDEYLTGISGFYGPVKGYNGLEAITSITFHTNKRIHGPYGEESGVGYTCFSSTSPCGKVTSLPSIDTTLCSASLFIDIQSLFIIIDIHR
ncbi:hypothetical protein L6452_34066 [Arctium lappa]|uniref:Uncharacterized protein n=1 Tax=Arctium lappa TaxID=4217 RepID=A0ACB8YGG0_ARCLA|nr:hypothetical protein L6452_34066 [Arctium lappa]